MIYHHRASSAREIYILKIYDLTLYCKHQKMTLLVSSWCKNYCCSWKFLLPIKTRKRERLAHCVKSREETEDWIINNGNNIRGGRDRRWKLNNVFPVSRPFVHESEKVIIWRNPKYKPGVHPRATANNFHKLIYHYILFTDKIKKRYGNLGTILSHTIDRGHNA